MSLPAEVSVIARGNHLEAIRAGGLKLRSGGNETVAVPAAAVSDPADLPPQDIVFVTLKSHALSDAAPAIARLLKPGGHAVFMTNGVPWWWHYGLAGSSHHLDLVDPGARLWDGLGAARCLGCVVYSMNEVVAPGVILHSGNNRWVLGEPDNRISARLQATVSLMKQAGLQADATPDLRLQILTKLLRNSALNPVCALTRLDVYQVGQRADLVLLCRQLSEEVARTAKAMGWNLDEALEVERAALADGGLMTGDKVKGVRPSMLQDVLACRRTEIAAILGETQQFARTCKVPTPAIDHLYALVAGLEAAFAD